MVRRLAFLAFALPFAGSVAVAFHPGVPSQAVPPVPKGREAPLAGTYDLDPTQTSVGFEVEHLGISRVQGRFTDVSGKVVFDRKHLDRSSVTLRVGVDSVDTAVAVRDKELKAREFFNATLYPEILFVSTHMWKGGRDYVMEGNLTVRGVTHEVRLLFKAYGVDGTTGKATKGVPAGVRMGLVARPLVLDRRDYGLPYDVKLPNGLPTVGYDVEVRLSIEAIREG